MDYTDNLLEIQKFTPTENKSSGMIWTIIAYTIFYLGVLSFIANWLYFIWVWKDVQVWRVPVLSVGFFAMGLLLVYFSLRDHNEC